MRKIIIEAVSKQKENNQQLNQPGRTGWETVGKEGFTVEMKQTT